MARTLADRGYRQRVVPSAKLYKRKPKVARHDPDPG
jgi:hypothetical protein